MDLIHSYSVTVISSLQQSLPNQRQLMLSISTFFDPRYAFLIFSPLVYSFDRRAGRKLMIVSVLAEWSNQLLKWILHGERPYWWIHENDIYGFDAPRIKQYISTCETGPGSPSGHAMVSAAVWFIITKWLIRQLTTFAKILNCEETMAHILWSFYSVILVLVSLSRVYIAAHFPHQCLLGMMIGISLAVAITNFDISGLKFRHYLLGTIGLLSSALFTYLCLQLLGFDPLWSINLAKKWCSRPDYIHLDTTPFFSMMRYSGFFFGCGLGFNSRLHQFNERHHLTFGHKIIAALLSIIVSKALSLIPYPSVDGASIYLFYIFAFIVHTLLPYLVIAVIPAIVITLWTTKCNVHKLLCLTKF